jgi:hypothetical protein
MIVDFPGKHICFLLRGWSVTLNPEDGDFPPNVGICLLNFCLGLHLWPDMWPVIQRESWFLSAEGMWPYTDIGLCNTIFGKDTCSWRTVVPTWYTYYRKVKVKMSPCLNSLSTTPWRRMSWPFLTSAIDIREWSASRPGRFTLRKRAPGTRCPEPV